MFQQGHGLCLIIPRLYPQTLCAVIYGHMTNTPGTITFASVVSREMVRITLMITALNDLEVKSADILNACVEVLVTEKGLDHVGFHVW